MDELLRTIVDPLSNNMLLSAAMSAGAAILFLAVRIWVRHKAYQGRQDAIMQLFASINERARVDRECRAHAEWDPPKIISGMKRSPKAPTVARPGSVRLLVRPGGVTSKNDWLPMVMLTGVTIESKFIETTHRGCTYMENTPTGQYDLSMDTYRDDSPAILAIERAIHEHVPIGMRLWPNPDTDTCMEADYRIVTVTSDMPLDDLPTMTIEAESTAEHVLPCLKEIPSP